MIRTPHNPDYEIGYGKPPKSTQFKPGQSGNPSGRKKKRFQSVAMSTLNEITRLITVQDGQGKRRLAVGQVMVRRLIADAAKGNTRAAQIVLNLLATLPAELQDQAQREQISNRAHELFVRLLDEKARAKGEIAELRQQLEAATGKVNP